MTVNTLPPLPSIPSPLIFLQDEDYKTYLTPLRKRGWSTENTAVPVNGTSCVKTRLQKPFEFQEADVALNFLIAAAEIGVNTSVSVFPPKLTIILDY